MTSGAPAGMDPNLYQQRPPIDLTNSALAQTRGGPGASLCASQRNVGEHYLLPRFRSPAPKTPPKGFGGVLTRQQWKGVIDFAHAVDAKLVTSFATSPGNPKSRRRLDSGPGTPVPRLHQIHWRQHRRREYMNEPTYAEMGGAPKGYDAAAYGARFRVFLPFMKKLAPDMLILGPGGVGEGIPLAPIGLAGSIVKTEDIS